ncbi:hypothetical protein ANN_14868 [Periplaneta americana]|uniref:Uncharacterized protein n=1 Tax=Periplaneta americana TaxID=6978 RepID=A0ABQ8SXG0_PERAM|nr:hypothetical protein ANN_14868 [Periplaneta americana]
MSCPSQTSGFNVPNYVRFLDSRLDDKISVSYKETYTSLSYFILNIEYEKNNFKKLTLDLNNHMEMIIDNKLRNDSARFLVILSGDSGSETVAELTLRSLKEYLTIFDCLVILKNNMSGTIDVFTWLPYHPPSGICGRFTKPILLDSWISDEAGGKFIHNDSLTPDKVPMNLQNCIPKLEESIDLNIMPYELMKFVNEIFQKTARNGKIEDGNVQAENDEYTTSFHEVILKISLYLHPAEVRIDLAAYFHTFSYSFYVPKAKPYARWMSISRVWGALVWLSVFLSLLLSAVVLRLLMLSRLVKQSDKYKSIGQCALDCWSVLLGVGVDLPSNTSLRFFFLFWILYSLCVNTVFQASVTSYFMDPGYEYQINSVEELIDHGFEIAFDNLNMMYEFAFQTNNSLGSYTFEKTKDALNYASTANFTDPFNCISGKDDMELERRFNVLDYSKGLSTTPRVAESVTTESYPAFAHIGLRENPGKNLNQVTCPDRESNPGHLVSRLDVLTVTP